MAFSRANDVRKTFESMSPYGKLARALLPSKYAQISPMLAAFATAFTQGSRFLALRIGDGETYAERLLAHSIEGFEALSSPSR